MKTTPLTQVFSILLIIFTSTLSSQALSSLRNLTKEDAKKEGIIVKSRPDGKAGTKVWLEFKKDRPLGDFTWIELRMESEDGQALLTTRLQPHPVTHGQPGDIVTVSFSVVSSQLDTCSFQFHEGGGLLGGSTFIIKVSDFLES